MSEDGEYKGDATSLNVSEAATAVKLRPRPKPRAKQTVNSEGE